MRILIVILLCCSQIAKAQDFGDTLVAVRYECGTFYAMSESHIEVFGSCNEMKVVIRDAKMIPYDYFTRVKLPMVKLYEWKKMSREEKDELRKLSPNGVIFIDFSLPYPPLNVLETIKTKPVKRLGA